MMDASSNTAGVVAPPPLIYLGFLLAGIALDWVWPAPFLPQTTQYLLGVLSAAAGLVLVGVAFRLFLRAGTSLRPDRPTTALITSGAYRYSRNPIYVALTLVYLGIGLAVDSLWVVGMLAGILPVMQYWVVIREERYLERKFGEDYRRYRAAVRRWL